MASNIPYHIHNYPEQKKKIYIYKDGIVDYGSPFYHITNHQRTISYDMELSPSIILVICGDGIYVYIHIPFIYI